LDVEAERVDRIVCRKCGRHLDVSVLQPFTTVKCPKCGTENYVPMKLGNFILLQILGRGGMGTVYRALDQSLGRYVAIKVMRRALGDDRQFVENFMREARAAAALNHPNVVQIYSCDEEHGQPYIVMELVDGGRLDAMIADGNPMDEVRALEIGIDVAEGLKAANEIGLIHGDIKPANILFDAHGTAKVVDFGLARFVNWEQDVHEIWGTPYYIAPEKARGQRVDHRSDIYSLGATLYHALGAKPPFDGKTATDVVLARLKNPAIGLRVIRPTLQPETADVIGRMLEADPFMRYPTYASLLADLREALRIAKQEKRSTHRKTRKSHTGPILATVAAFVVALGLLGAGLWMLRQGGHRPVHRPAAGTVPPPAAAERAEAGGRETRPAGGGEAVARARPHRTRAILDPFTAPAAVRLVAAASDLASGKALAAEEKFQSLYDRLPAGGMGRYWIRLFQATACWYDGRDDAAGLYTAEILKGDFPAAGERMHPGRLLQDFVHFMSGSLPEGRLRIDADAWPGWLGHLVDFYTGLRAVREGDLEYARETLSRYESCEKGKPEWVYMFQPLAAHLDEQSGRVLETERALRRCIKDGHVKRARDGLEQLQNAAPRIFAHKLKALNTLVVAAEKVEEERRRIAARRKHEETVQGDLDLLDNVIAGNLALIARWDFMRASAQLTAVMPRLKTPEGREMFRVLRDSYDRMERLKKFLIASIRARPYTAATRELGGNVVGATLSELSIALGGHGMLRKQWGQVSLALLVRMAESYIKISGDADKQADEYLSLAVLCYYGGGYKVAARYAARAVKLNRRLEREARRLMPGLLEG